jgi:site-specific recombinase XerD
MHRVSDENRHKRRDTKNMDIDTAKIRFKNYLESSGYAASTIECYSVYLGYFLDYLRKIKVMDLKQVTHETIRTYQLLVADMAIAEETKGMRLRPVKRLFGWLLDTHRLLLDPTEKIRLTVAEMRLLLEQPNLSLRMQIRDRAIMETLYSSGIRLNELVQLTVHDVDLKDKVLHIRKGKGNRQRVVPIGKNAATYLQEYLENTVCPEEQAAKTALSHRSGQAGDRQQYQDIAVSLQKSRRNHKDRFTAQLPPKLCNPSSPTGG